MSYEALQIFTHVISYKNRTWLGAGAVRGLNKEDTQMRRSFWKNLSDDADQDGKADQGQFWLTLPEGGA